MQDSPKSEVCGSEGQNVLIDIFCAPTKSGTRSSLAQVSPELCWQTANVLWKYAEKKSYIST